MIKSDKENITRFLKHFFIFKEHEIRNKFMMRQLFSEQIFAIINSGYIRFGHGFRGIHIVKILHGMEGITWLKA